MKHLIVTATILALTSPACARKTDDVGEEQPMVDLEPACANFCARALACDSVHFAANWEFQDQQTCESKCQDHTEIAAMSFPNENCADVYGELWTCGGEIEACSEFEALDKNAFAESSAVPNPCDDELQAALSRCN